MVKSVILAAGKGTRMKSDKPKVVHQVMGKPMVYYSIEAARQAGADEVCVIVGYKADEVKSAIAASVNDVEKELADVQARRDSDFNTRFPEAEALVQRSIGGKDADADRQRRGHGSLS